MKLHLNRIERNKRSKDRTINRLLKYVYYFQSRRLLFPYFVYRHAIVLTEV